MYMYVLEAGGEISHRVSALPGRSPPSPSDPLASELDPKSNVSAESLRSAERSSLLSLILTPPLLTGFLWRLFFCLFFFLFFW